MFALDRRIHQGYLRELVLRLIFELGLTLSGSSFLYTPFPPNTK